MSARGLVASIAPSPEHVGFTLDSRHINMEQRRNATARRGEVVEDHVIIGALSAPGKLRHETARRLARPRDRPRLRISVRGAAGQFLGSPRAALQRAEPADAALYS